MNVRFAHGAVPDLLQERIEMTGVEVVRPWGAAALLYSLIPSFEEYSRDCADAGLVPKQTELEP
jgi:hypothetical protein